MHNVIKEKVRVTMHLPGGYTKVFIEATLGVRIAHGGIEVDIPTEIIPFRLRGIGSRFVLVLTTAQTQKTLTEMTSDEMRKLETLSVEEIRDE